MKQVTGPVGVTLQAAHPVRVMRRSPSGRDAARMVDAPRAPAAAAGMVWIRPGPFLMGSDEFYPEERPVRRVRVGGFWIDPHPVTVAEFRRFAEATGHVTVAERAPRAAEHPDVDPALLVPGSLVFQRARGPVALDDQRA